MAGSLLSLGPPTFTNNGVIALSPPAPIVAPDSAELPQPPEQPFSAVDSLNQFNDAQRMATLLAHSWIIPENYRGDDHLGNCVIALEMANRIGASILAPCKTYVLVQGKSAWSPQFLLSCVNSASGIPLSLTR